MVEETVDRILDWQLIRFFRVQKPEPVLLLENEAKHQLKQIRTGESEIFLDGLPFEDVSRFPIR